MPQSASLDKVTKIVLTGGPCGGKSSCLQYIVRSLKDEVDPDTGEKFKVFVAPEMPTLLNTCEAGFPFWSTPEHQSRWEGSKMYAQAMLEDSLENMVEQGRHTVLICDRGLPDSAAFCSEDDFQTILAEYHWTEEELMQRYGLVIHLETAAIDTDVYETQAANNSARRETKEEAVEADKKAQAAWAQHPKVAMIRNQDCTASEKPFDLKKEKTLQACKLHLGITTPALLKRHRFVLEQAFPFAELPKDPPEYTIEATFLRDHQQANRVVERRGRAGQWAYMLCTCNTRNVERGMKEMKINGRQYQEFLIDKDPKRKTVTRSRRTFILEIPSVGRTVTHRVDTYVGGPTVMTVDLSPDARYTPPEFMQRCGIKEIIPGGGPQHTLRELAGGK